jgi:nucleotide-binding universal stress UspA family protein
MRRTTTGSPAIEYKSVIVGLDGREHDADTLALGRSLQRSLGDLADSLWLVHVIPPGPPGQGQVALEAIEREDGKRLLTHAAMTVGGYSETELIGPASPAEGLARLASTLDAPLLVLGSSHRGAVGRVVPGGVASRLLAHAPCAIAVAPSGYAKLAQGSISRIGVAYDATSEADLALAAAVGAATRLGVPLHLYHAMHEISTDPGWDKFRGHMQDFAQGIIDSGLQRLPAEVDATGSVLEGDVAEVVAEAAGNDGVGLLYVGSRGYGPLREALLGGVAGALLQAAYCPLVIVPRGAQAAVDRSSTISSAHTGT